VVAQFAIMAVIAGSWLIPVRVDVWVVQILAVVLAATGVLLFGSAYRAMGQSFTAFPRPRASGEFVCDGPFRLVRHPTYGGGLLLFAGVSLGVGIAGLIGTAALLVLWWRKSSYEERLLEERFPGYAAYRARVRRRFFPGLL
jgi:protein-S-isoprenylcysteine O-methyltransferase Ste14